MLLSAFPEALVAERAIAEVLLPNLVAADPLNTLRYCPPDAGRISIDAGAGGLCPGGRVESGHLCFGSLQSCFCMGNNYQAGPLFNFFQILNGPINISKENQRGSTEALQRIGGAIKRHYRGSTEPLQRIKEAYPLYSIR